MLVHITKIELDGRKSPFFNNLASYRVHYHQNTLPDNVRFVYVAAEDELDAYRRFKPVMYQRFGLTVFVAGRDQKT